MMGALSDERTGLPYTMYSVQCIQGLCQSRLSTRDHALSLVASAYEF
jgi:hypothetical protein